MDGIDLFHPAVAAWFERRFGTPTEPQIAAWPAIRAGRHALIAAPTGSGKTLAAFLAAIDDLVRRGLAEGGLPDAVQVVYVSPLKALSNDVQKNLEEPLAGIRAELAARGLPEVEIRALVRTGDTPAAVRTAMARRPPHILVTTPESLYILLTSESGRRMLATARTVIVDEIHAVAGDKRGSHLALTLERLSALVESATGEEPVRIGLSATQRPLIEVARFLVGTRNVDAAGNPDCLQIDCDRPRERSRLDLGIELPRSPLETVMAGEVWEEVYDRLAELVRQHRTTLIFANTRRLAERVTHHLAKRLGAGAVTSHHGSLAKETRLSAEQRLKAGELRALVATASLELGIDIGTVDLVCQLGITRSIAAFLQRVGRSGHHRGGISRGRLFPLNRDELVEAAALFGAVWRGELERLEIPEKPLDILAQQLVAAVAAEEQGEAELFALVRGAWPYRALAREEFDRVVALLAEGFATRSGRRSAYLHWDEVNGRLRPRKGARLAAVTSGGAIPDVADYQVVLEPNGAVVGTVFEDFAVESLPGEVFQLGSTSWRIRKIEPGRMLVEDARGEPPSIPFWRGEAPGRSDELSAAVSDLRRNLGEELEEAVFRLEEETGICAQAAGEIVDYLSAARAALGELPSGKVIVAERFFDEAGDQHLVIHAPLGSRINRAWGLALRKRFCRTFNFELQAAASEDAIVLSLGPTHSFPLEEVFGFLHAATVREILVQAVLDSPLFPVRWRWNAGRSLALPRWRGGRRVPPPLLRQQAEDLTALVFPDQLACLENIAGDREVPDHPLVAQTLHDCLTEALDVVGLERLLAGIEAGEIATLARDLAEPSPLALAILNSPVYTFLDDAPLEERRTRAVAARRWLDPAAAGDLARLDETAVARVRAEAWPEAESADELHDALVTLGFLTAEEGEGAGWRPWLEELAGAGRAAEAWLPGGWRLWLAAERLPQLAAVFAGRAWRRVPEIEPPARLARDWTPETALAELIRGRLQGLGPTTAEKLAAPLELPPSAAEAALAALEQEGFALRGRFTAEAPEETEWCERRLLARIHRLTLDRLRREIDPVPPAGFLRFLLAWQGVAAEEKPAGREGLARVLAQLDGFEAAAASWEEELLPARLQGYDPDWLDALCLTGRFAWGRFSEPGAWDGRRLSPIRTTPVAFVDRAGLEAPASSHPAAEGLTGDVRTVYERLERRGAAFFREIATGTGLLWTQVEEALAELVARGLATADSPAGLRALLLPARKRAAVDRWRLSGGPFDAAGRWSLLPGRVEPEAAVEIAARRLLRRWGVVFRRLLEREPQLPPWRELLPVLRRLEARGEIRGGRFVDGFSGEQFALPEAVGKLRAVHKAPATGAWVVVSAADPLSLTGIVLPGPRLPLWSGNRVLYRDGVPLAYREGREIRFLADLDAAERWQAETALLRRPGVEPKPVFPRQRAAV